MRNDLAASISDRRNGDKLYGMGSVEPDRANRRQDAKIYRQAERILRERHLDEFNQIRQDLLKEAGITLETSHNNLTADKAKVLTFIQEFVWTNGYCPTITTITRALHLGSQERIRKIILKLENEGVIRRLHTRMNGKGNYELI